MSALLLGWQGLSVDASVAKVAIKGLLALFGILSVFVIKSIVIGVASWIDYQKDEVALPNEAVRHGFRQILNRRAIFR